MRYAPERPFPPYAFLPGRDPHPTRDAAGHSFGLDEHTALYFAPHCWADNDDYLWGVDLYNHGFLWEAHEAWEGLWHQASHDRLQADHLQGLIQCAAAWLKILMKQPRGVQQLSERALERLERVARESGGHFMGLDLEAFPLEVSAFANAGSHTIDGLPTITLEEPRCAR